MCRKNKVDIDKLDSVIEFLQNNKTVECNPYPQYAPEIFDALGMLEVDKNYSDNHEKIASKPISEMNRKEIATMLTFISRGERFCDGHIMSYVESGTLLQLMQRLKEISGGEKSRRG